MFAIALVFISLSGSRFGALNVAMGVNTNYFVDNVNGNDSYSGGCQTLSGNCGPWKTLTKVNQTTFGSGDSINFKAGGSWTGTLRPLGSGVSGSPIVIGKYGSGSKPILNGGGISSSYTNTASDLCSSAVVCLLDQQYWTIQNLDITNKGTSAAHRRAIFIGNTQTSGTLNTILIQNNSIHDINGNSEYHDGGIAVELTQTSTTASFNDIQILNNSFSNLGDDNTVGGVGVNIGVGNALDSLPQSNYFTGVKINNNSFDNVLGNNVIISNTNGAEVRNNLSSNGGNSTKWTAAIWPTRAINTVISENEVYNYQLKVSPGDGQSFDNDVFTNNSIFQYNYSHDNPKGFMVWFHELQKAAPPQGSKNGIVRYNISQNDGRPFYFQFNDLSVNGEVFSGTQVYNNTIYTYAVAMIEMSVARNLNGHVSWKNNIFYLNAASNSYHPNIGDFNYNIFYGGNHPSSEPSDANKLTTNPNFKNPGSGSLGRNTVDGYKLLNGSPALGSGTLIGNNGGVDYFGNLVSSTLVPNRGAYNGLGVAAGGFPGNKYIVNIAYPGYRLQASGGTYSNISNTHDVLTSNWTPNNEHKWQLVDAGTGLYYIQSVKYTGYRLQAAGGNFQGIAGTHDILTSSWTANNEHKWKLVDAGSGNYYVESLAYPGYRLQASGGNYQGIAGTHDILTSNWTPNNEHKWSLVSAP